MWLWHVKRDTIAILVWELVVAEIELVELKHLAYHTSRRLSKHRLGCHSSHTFSAVVPQKLFTSHRHERHTINLVCSSRSQAQKLQDCQYWYGESFKAVVSACRNLTAPKTLNKYPKPQCSKKEKPYVYRNADGVLCNHCMISFPIQLRSLYNYDYDCLATHLLSQI